MDNTNALLEHRLDALNIRDKKHLAVIREAVLTRQQLVIRYNGHTRIVLPHRIWVTDAGIYVESFQAGGGSVWGAVGEGGFVSDGSGGWKGWATLHLDKIESLSGAGRGFTPHRDFNPDPKRRLGEVLAQVQ